MIGYVRVALCGLLLAVALPAAAQQRPLVTEDPEPIGAGRVLVEGGVDYGHDVQYPVSGLEGNLWRIPMLGVSVGISSIAEFQIDGGIVDHLSITKRNPAPLAHLVNVQGDSTHDVDDMVIATKIRFLSEGPSRPALAIRFATKLPNASNESGLGNDTTDFYASLIGAKTVQSVRTVVNLGLGIIGDPTNGERQNDLITYGVSFARALTQKAEFVGEVNGRISTRSDPFPGGETRGLLKVGGRYTQGPVRFDAAVFFGLNTPDPTIGFTAGFTYVFDAFRLP